ncbi:MAG: acyltransferase family protein [Casimicrobium sp.]
MSNDRLVSLDAFRGFTIAGMVLVNNPGDWNNAYGQLLHAKWHGWTFTDWIFPFFLFIVGVSMVFSLSKKPVANEQRGGAVLSLWKRAAIIFLIGLTLNFIPSFNLETLRVPGVLQRIALCTAIAAPIVVFFGWRVWLVAIGLLFVAYSVPMLFVSIAGGDGIVAAGRLEAGKDFGAFIDRALLSGHLWASAKTWDPEGVFSTLPAVASLLFGALTGRWLLADATRSDKTVWMLLVGLLLVWIGAMLDVVLMPINKPLWTVSYAVFMAGWSLVVFAAFYWLIDACAQTYVTERARRYLLPLTIYGMNALFIFAFSSLIAKILNAIKVTDANGAVVSLKTFFFSFIKALPVSPINASLVFAVLFNLAMFFVAWLMWKKRWFVKV